MNKFMCKLVKNNFIIILGFILTISLFFTATFEESYILALLMFIVILINSLLINLLKSKLSYKLMVLLSMIFSLLLTFGFSLLLDSVITTDNLSKLFLVVIVNNFIIISNSLINPTEKYKTILGNNMCLIMLYILLLLLFSIVKEIFSYNTLTIIYHLQPLFGFGLKISNILPDSPIINVNYSHISNILILLGLTMALALNCGKGEIEDDEFDDSINS